MALIAMAVYSTEENGKNEYLDRTLQSLEETVDFTKHRLILSVNAYTAETLLIFRKFKGMFTLIFNDYNLGTAEAINLAWKDQWPNENLIKMDDDVIFHANGWVDRMEEAIQRDPTIGQCGLKRRDCTETPWNPDPFYKSKLEMLPHSPGEKWIVVEEVSHVMGTCVMHSSALLDKVGYLYQPKLYGFDDSFMSLRSRIAGFRNVFLPGIDIEHIDRGDTGFQKWKEKHAGECWQEYMQVVRDYTSGKKSVYYNPFENE
jgi:GT2 family glycosyltransferase